MISFEAIFGENDAQWALNEYLAARFIRKDWRAFERSLFTSKWFDYRPMHCIEATRQFADVYQNTYRTAFGRTKDTTRMRFVRGLAHCDVFSDKYPATTRSGLIRARQHADAMGTPYEFYCHYAFEKACSWKRDHLPRPSQLYSADVLEHVLAKWEEAQKTQLFVAHHAMFQSDAFCHLPAQNDYHEWLFSQIELRSNTVFWLNHFVFQERLIPERKAVLRFGEEIVADSRNYH